MPLIRMGRIPHGTRRIHLLYYIGMRESQSPAPISKCALLFINVKFVRPASGKFGQVPVRVGNVKPQDNFLATERVSRSSGPASRAFEAARTDTGS